MHKHSLTPTLSFIPFSTNTPPSSPCAPWPKVSKHTVSVYFFYLPLRLSFSLFSLRKKGKKAQDGSAEQKLLFFPTFPACNEFFKTSHLQMCRGIDRSSHCKVSHCLESISTALYLFTVCQKCSHCCACHQQDKTERPHSCTVSLHVFPPLLYLFF